MSLFLNARGIYLLLMRAPIMYLYCATLFFLASIVSGWWFFIYSPSLKSIENLYQTLDEMHQKTLMVKKTEQELAVVTRSISEIKISMTNLGLNQPRKDVIQQMLAFVADTALQNGMNVNLCKLSEQNSSATANQIIFAGRGNLDQLIIFFETLKSSKKIFDCTACDMTRADHDAYNVKVVLNILHG